MEKTKGKVRRNIWVPHKLNLLINDRAQDMGIPGNAWILLAVHHFLHANSLTVPAPQTVVVQPKAPIDTYHVIPRRFKKLKRRATDKGYTPPDYFPEDDGTPMPQGARPLPWAVIQKVGAWMSDAEQEHDPLPQPKDIARHFKIPQADAAVAHDAYVTEFYANQLELLEKKP